MVYETSFVKISNMTEIIQQHRAEIEDLCRRHQVRVLELFGSAANGTFDPNQSDLDFLVDFLPLEPVLQARSYFGLLFDLEDLFARKIDLVETGAVENPYFLRSINKNRTVLYAA
jgi:predicted nucleotidyltransferase